jgi:hypothetical protein
MLATLPCGKEEFAERTCLYIEGLLERGFRLKYFCTEVQGEGGTVAINIHVNGNGGTGQVQFSPAMEVSEKIASYGVKEITEKRKGNYAYAFALALLVVVQGDIWPFCDAAMSSGKFKEAPVLVPMERTDFSRINNRVINLFNKDSFESRSMREFQSANEMRELIKNCKSSSN